MLHDPNFSLAVERPTTRLVTVKVIDPAYELYCNLLLNPPWSHRAPHANRPTPPKRKWAWEVEQVNA